MTKIIKFGSLKNAYFHNLSDFLIKDFEKLNPIYPIENIIIKDSDEAFICLSDAVINGEIDFFAFPMDQCPILSDNSDLIITAIKDRSFVGEVLIFNAQQTKVKDIHDLKSGFHIGVFNKCHQKQLNHLFPNSEFSIFQNQDRFDYLQQFNSMVDGIVISALEYNFYFKNGHQFGFIPLHPTELIPFAGHGVIAFICHKENFQVRKVLNQIHCHSMVKITNIERSILKYSNENGLSDIGVYCYEDHRGHFHIYGYNSETDKKARFSQSVSHGLTAKMSQSLFSK